MWAKQRERFAEWYQGQYVPPPPNDPDSAVVFISPGHYQKSAPAQALTWIVSFWLEHWKWVIGIVVALGIAFLKR